MDNFIWWLIGNASMILTLWPLYWCGIINFENPFSKKAFIKDVKEDGCDVFVRKLEQSLKRVR